MRTREICKACNRESAVGFHVPDEIWEATPRAVDLRVLCVGCFTHLADAAGLEWDRDIQFWPVSLVTARFNEEPKP